MVLHMDHASVHIDNANINALQAPGICFIPFRGFCAPQALASMSTLTWASSTTRPPAFMVSFLCDPPH